jgi:hypothetical protein
MTQQHQILIAADGSIRFIWDDELVELITAGTARVDRASRVDPSPGGPQFAGWTVDLTLSDGPVLSGFALRSQALAAERKWIEEHVLTSEQDEWDAFNREENRR